MRNIMTNNKKKLLIILVSMLIVIVLIFNIPIFSSVNDVEDCYFDLVKRYPNKNIYILRYSYTTGVSWLVENTNDSDLLNEYVAIKTRFDPRLLKNNADYSMDYMAEYIIVSDKKKKIKLYEETVDLIYADKIFIKYETLSNKYYIRDLQFWGIIKSLLHIHVSY